MKNTSLSRCLAYAFSDTGGQLVFCRKASLRNSHRYFLRRWNLRGSLSRVIALNLRRTYGGDDVIVGKPGGNRAWISGAIGLAGPGGLISWPP
jgi:hypothetical protein